MKKFLAVFVALMAMVASAHTTDTKFIDNTYVTVKGGVTALMHPNHGGYNGYQDWGHTIEAATGLELGKWITPHWGASIEGVNGWTNGSKVGAFQDDYAVNYLTVGALAKYRFMPAKRFNISLATGPVWNHGFKKDAKDMNDLGAKFKIEFNIALCDRIDLQIAPELTYNFSAYEMVDGVKMPRIADQPRFDSRNAWYGLMVGVTYNIGKKFTECPYLYTQADMDRMNAEINDLRARQPEVVEKIVEKVVVKSANVAEVIVLFDKNSAVLSDDAKAMLNGITGDVEVIGSASPEGTEARNKQLANDRANVVADYLKGRNVNVKNVTTDLNIGSRAAIIK